MYCITKVINNQYRSQNFSKNIFFFKLGGKLPSDGNTVKKIKIYFTACVYHKAGIQFESTIF